MEAGAVTGEGHALVIPECGRRRDAPGEQVSHGVIADRDRLQRCRATPDPATIERSTAVSDGAPVIPTVRPPAGAGW